MCSIGEDDFGDEGGVHAMQNDFSNMKFEYKTGDVCKKCKNAEIVVKIDFREAECKECFLSYVRHKFRATLGSTKILPKNSEVLLITDGNQESIALLDMVHYALNQDNFKRLRCNVKLLYVDDNFLFKKSQNNISDIEKILKKYNLNSYVISLTSTSTSSSSKGKPMKFNEYLQLDLIEEENKFMKILDNIQSLTSKQDFLMKIQRNVINLAAIHLNCQFIFLPDINSDLAATFLTNISLGGGSSVALDVSLLDDRISNIKLIRPIKDLTINEISNYIQLNNLKYLEKFKYGEENINNSKFLSIQNLTKEFVKNLQQNFPSTVSTVYRTGDKIASATTNKIKQKNSNTSSIVNNKNSLENNANEKCQFCKSKLDTIISDSLEAIKFSKLVSTRLIKNIENIDDVQNVNLDEFETDIPKNLCHTCRNIYQDSNCKNIL